MVIGISRITLHLPEVHSLKEKRQIVKSVLARVRNGFSVAIAEVEDNDLWQKFTLGYSCVANDSQLVDEILDNVLRYIEETRPDIPITDIQREIISW